MSEEAKSFDVEWKSNLPALLGEILNNQSCWALKIPLQITGDIFNKVAERAAEINDPQLNHLMCRLALYSVADPYHKDYDPAVVEQVAKMAEEAANEEQKNNG